MAGVEREIGPTCQSAQGTSKNKSITRSRTWAPGKPDRSGRPFESPILDRAGEHILSRAQHDAASVPQGEARLRRSRGLSRRRLSLGRSTRLSYTWSRLEGNYSGAAQSDEDGRVAPNTGRNFDHPMMAFDELGEPVYGVAADRPPSPAEGQPRARPRPRRKRWRAMVPRKRYSADTGSGVHLSRLGTRDVPGSKQ